jgi:hypothetical protein
MYLYLQPPSEFVSHKIRNILFSDYADEEKLKQAKLTIVRLCSARSGRPAQLSEEPFHSLAGGVGVVHSRRLIERELNQQL